MEAEQNEIGVGNTRICQFLIQFNFRDSRKNGIEQRLRV